MKLGPVTKLDTKSKVKKINNDVCRKNVTSLSFSRLLANLEQFGGWIPDRESVKVMFSLIVTFCLTKTEKRTKKSLTQLSRYSFK